MKPGCYMFVINGELLTASDTGGFDNREFTVTLLPNHPSYEPGSQEVRNCTLGSYGTIPDEYRKELPDNARITWKTAI